MPNNTLYNVSGFNIRDKYPNAEKKIVEYISQSDFYKMTYSDTHKLILSVIEKCKQDGETVLKIQITTEPYQIEDGKALAVVAWFV